MTLQEFRDVLLSVCDSVYHYESDKEAEYIVWHEIGSISLRGDCTIAESGVMIAVDFFTATEYSDIPENVSAALAACDEIAVDDPEVIYDSDTGIIHYAWLCEVI